MTSHFPSLRTAPAPVAAEQRRCCGGVDCQPPEWDVKGTYCEKHPGQCRDCSGAGRRYIGGSCSDPLASGRSFLLRLSYANGFTPAADQVCVRLSGTAGWTCTQSPAPMSIGMSTRLPIRVADITGSGRGIDIEVRSAGAVIASRAAARLDSLSTAMLCIGMMLNVNEGRTYFFLDEP